MYDSLTTVAAVKAWLPIKGDADDAEIGTLIPVASELIGRFCARENLGGVYPYTESYFGSTGGGGLMGTRAEFNIVLRHWPIVTVSQVMINGSVIPLLDATGLQTNQAGVYVQEDYEARILKFRYLFRSYPITIQYTAGYTPGLIPFPLRQAANQYCAEILRSQTWLGRKSVSVLGETVSFDMGGELGMSTRIQSMLKPFMNNIPFLGFGT